MARAAVNVPAQVTVGIPRLMDQRPARTRSCATSQQLGFGKNTATQLLNQTHHGLDGNPNTPRASGVKGLDRTR